MRPSENVFGMLQDRGKRGVAVDDRYRQLYNPHLYLRAYGRIYANDGAMTRGSTEETADAMSLAKIRKIIEDLRHERYRWTPVRRTLVPKKNGKNACFRSAYVVRQTFTGSDSELARGV